MDDNTGLSRTFENFFDRIYVINLPSRPDRLESIRSEMSRLGISDHDDKIVVPEAPICDDAGGFPTKGVRGNFFSHLQNIEDAHKNGFERILVLEDDAIFRSNLRSPHQQDYVLSQVEAHDWSMWFPGHRLRSHPKGAAKPVYPSRAEFWWAHCYAVHRRGLAPLRDYMKLVSERPSGHPEGGKMYIDGALYHFRRRFTDHTCLVSNPVLSIQKSSDTNLGTMQNPFHYGSVPWVKSILRQAKDELWRRTGVRLAVPKRFSRQ
ncbi:hypothetical protein [Aliiroseovarius sp. YM-037]|uniref:hypothetical protein n=1 Tax=Aliiroseovarius sp. YM-037 TaxID=3341728 RepID=UPI003A80E742